MLAERGGALPIAVLVSAGDGEIAGWAHQRRHDRQVDRDPDRSSRRGDPMPYALIAEDIIEGWLCDRG